MKKFLILFTILLFALSSICQYSVGGRLGVNFATLTGKYSENDDSKNGWIASVPAIGVVGNYKFTDMISLNAELLFITIGDKTKYLYEGERSSLSEYDYILTERYHYIQLPILAKFSFGSDILFYGNAGPYCGYKMGGHHKYEEGGHVTKGRLRFKEDKLGENDWLYDSETERRFDFGIYIGGGAGKEIGPGRLEADLRLGIGLLDHNKFESKEYKKDLKDNGYKSFRTTNISLTFAYMYMFSKKKATRYLDE